MSDMPSDIQIYCDYMVEVRTRIAIIQAVLEGRIGTGIEGCNNELIFLQFRKILEVIAFASLAANKQKYSQVHANFAKHWKPEKMLAELEKINANFYPTPLEAMQAPPNGVKHFPLMVDGFMTKNEFVSLYNVCSDVMHKQNPYSRKRSDNLYNLWRPQVGRTNSKAAGLPFGST
jgi:hypothetical protein